jgi:hypothetical protein
VQLLPQHPHIAATSSHIRADHSEVNVFVDVSALTMAQYLGTACVVDGHVFGQAEQPVRVGLLGNDLHPVHACARVCARQVERLVSELRPKHALRAS